MKTLETKNAIEVSDGMLIEWDVSISMRDGLALKADIFRPTTPGRYPVLMTYGPYGKGLAFQDGYKTCWDRMAEDHPDVVEGSSNKFQNWEVVDPEKWVPHDYVCIRVDSRGAGMSPGYMQLWSPQEAIDFYDCIEWAGVQDWSNGKVGLNGISYYAMNQWQVASLQPPHLAAICPWEGAADMYRDLSHHGGILCDFIKNWYDMQVRTVQHGLGQRGPKSRVTGKPVCGEATPNFLKTAKTLPMPHSNTPWMTPIGVPECLTGPKLPYPSSLQPIGAAKVSIREVISKVFPEQLRTKNGSKFMELNTGPISIRTTDGNFNLSFSTIFCMAKKMAGTASPRCYSIFATLVKNLSSAQRTSGL